MGTMTKFNEELQKLIKGVLAYRDAVNILGWPSMHSTERGMIEAMIELAEYCEQLKSTAAEASHFYSNGVDGPVVEVTVTQESKKEMGFLEMNHPAVPMPGTVVRTMDCKWLVKSVEQTPRINDSEKLSCRVAYQLIEAGLNDGEKSG